MLTLSLICLLNAVFTLGSGQLVGFNFNKAETLTKDHDKVLNLHVFGLFISCVCLSCADAVSGDQHS